MYCEEQGGHLAIITSHELNVSENKIHKHDFITNISFFLRPCLAVCIKRFYMLIEKCVVHYPTSRILILDISKCLRYLFLRF